MKTKLFLLLTVLFVLSTKRTEPYNQRTCYGYFARSHHSRQCIAMDHGLHSGDRSDFGHAG